MSQLCAFKEPPLGTSWDLILTEVGALVSAPSKSSVHVTQLSSPFSPGANCFGWSADGASVNGVKLQARVVLALAVVELNRNHSQPPPPDGCHVIGCLQRVSVKFTSYANVTSRCISMWKETCVAWKTNVKLNPLMQAKSLKSFGILSPQAIDDLCSKFDKTMSVVDAGLRPQGTQKIRMKNFVNEAKFPNEHWNHLEEYFAEPGRRYESSGYSDKHFDVQGFWVGNSAVATLQPFWKGLVSVTRESQMTSMLWAERSNPRLSVDSWTKHCAAAATIHNVISKGVAAKSVDFGVASATIVELRKVADGAVYTQTNQVLESLPDVDPEDPIEFFKDTFPWFRALCEDSVQSFRPAESGEAKRLRVAHQDLRTEAFLKDAQAEILEFKESIANLDKSLKDREEEQKRQGSKIMIATKKALDSDLFKEKFSIVHDEHLKRVPDDWKSFIALIRANEEIPIDRIGFHGFCDLSINGAYSPARTRILNGIIMAITEMPWQIFYPDTPRSARQVTKCEGAAGKDGAGAGGEENASDEDVSDEDEEMDSGPLQEELDSQELPAGLEGRPLKIRRTEYANDIQLSRDLREIDTTIAYANLESRNPKWFSWRACRNGVVKKSYKGFMLVPADHAEQRAWYNETGIMKYGIHDCTYAENIMDMRKPYISDIMAQGISKRVELRPRRQVASSYRWQKGMTGYLEYLNELCVQAQKQGISALALLEVGSGAGDLLMAAYQRELDGIASGTPLAVRVYVLSVNHLDRHKFATQHRLHSSVYQDFNADPPRYSLKGFPPHTQTNRADPAESRLACVRAMQAKFKRVTVLCKDDGTEAKLYVPDLTPEMTASLTPEGVLAYNDLQGQHGRPPENLPAQNPATDPAAVPSATEYFSKEALEKEWSVVKTMASSNCKIHACVPIQSTPEAGPKVLFAENPSPKDRVTMQKGDILVRKGRGNFEQVSGENVNAENIHCRFMLHTYKKDSASNAAIPEKDAMILLKTASGVKLMNLTDAFKETSGDAGTVWGFRRDQARRGNRTITPYTVVEFKPEPAGTADWSTENVGQILPSHLDDWMTVFEMGANARGELQPPNGQNAAAVVARKKFVIPCGRVMRIK